MTNAQQNLENQCSHQFGDGNEMTIAQKIEFAKNQEGKSNNKQQTAVEQLISKIPLGMRMQLAELGVDFEQAKEMEKEQMIEFGELCWKNLLRSDVIMRPRDVYNETYGGNK
jgi:hypothetical protein